LCSAGGESVEVRRGVYLPIDQVAILCVAADLVVQMDWIFGRYLGEVQEKKETGDRRQETGKSRAAKLDNIRCEMKLLLL